jgi:hypothetical protein
MTSNGQMINSNLNSSAADRTDFGSNGYNGLGMGAGGGAGEVKGAGGGGSDGECEGVDGAGDIGGGGGMGGMKQGWQEGKQFEDEMLVGAKVPAVERRFLGATVSDGRKRGRVIGFFDAENEVGDDDYEPPYWVAEVDGRKYLLEAEDMVEYLTSEQPDKQEQPGKQKLPKFKLIDLKLFALDIEISFSRSNRGSFPLFSTSICNDFFLPQNAASQRDAECLLACLETVKQHVYKSASILDTSFYSRFEAVSKNESNSRLYCHGQYENNNNNNNNNNSTARAVLFCATSWAQLCAPWKYPKGEVGGAGGSCGAGAGFGGLLVIRSNTYTDTWKLYNVCQSRLTAFFFFVFRAYFPISGFTATRRSTW